MYLKGPPSLQWINLQRSFVFSISLGFCALKTHEMFCLFSPKVLWQSFSLSQKASTTRSTCSDNTHHEYEFHRHQPHVNKHHCLFFYIRRLSLVLFLFMFRRRPCFFSFCVWCSFFVPCSFFLFLLGSRIMPTLYGCLLAVSGGQFEYKSTIKSEKVNKTAQGCFEEHSLGIWSIYFIWAFIFWRKYGGGRIVKSLMFCQQIFKWLGKFLDKIEKYFRGQKSSPSSGSFKGLFTNKARHDKMAICWEDL